MLFLYGDVQSVPRGGLTKKNGNGILGVLECAIIYFDFVVGGMDVYVFVLMGLIQSRYGLMDDVSLSLSGWERLFSLLLSEWDGCSLEQWGVCGGRAACVPYGQLVLLDVGRWVEGGVCWA